MLCVVIGVLVSLSVEGTEFSGGSVTGRLLSLQGYSLWVFLLATLATFLFPRAAPGIGLCAVATSLPLYLFLVTPGAFRALFRGEWKVPTDAFFTWNASAVAAIVACGAAAYVQLRAPRPRTSA